MVRSIEEIKGLIESNAEAKSTVVRQLHSMYLLRGYCQKAQELDLYRQRSVTPPVQTSGSLTPSSSDSGSMIGVCDVGDLQQRTESARSSHIVELQEKMLVRSSTDIEVNIRTARGSYPLEFVVPADLLTTNVRALSEMIVYFENAVGKYNQLIKDLHAELLQAKQDKYINEYCTPSFYGESADQQ